MGLALLSLTLMVLGCASPTHRAPVEDRAVQGRSTLPAPSAALPASAGSASAAPTGTASAGPAPLAAGATALPVSPSGAAPEPLAPRPPPGIENLGKPGYYAVKPGDTLIRIGLESGQNWKDIVRWNNLENANVIEVGQVLRVVPPGSDPTAAVTRPVVVPPVAAAGAPGGASSAAVGTGARASVPAPAAVTGAGVPGPTGTAGAAIAAAGGDDDLTWTWPANGPVLAGFDEARSKGLAIGGKAGDAVVAAADGRVVYAGSGLRGYGNLVIVKHNNTFLTAYAHNQTLLVREDQTVRRGQRIAEMGSTDAERVQLHFEIRRQGRPVDPARLLPAR